MKKRTFDRTMTAATIWLFRRMVRENMENPTRNNWMYARNLYMKVSAFGLIGIISRKTEKRAEKMFEGCTPVYL